MSLANLLKDWKIELHSGIPAYKQIANRLTSGHGGLHAAHGDRLPTIRELHEILGVNPNTVAKAYREMALKGLIDGQRGFACLSNWTIRSIRCPEPEKNAKLKESSGRMLTEARGHGLNEGTHPHIHQTKENHMNTIKRSTELSAIWLSPSCSGKRNCCCFR